MHLQRRDNFLMICIVPKNRMGERNLQRIVSNIAEQTYGLKWRLTPKTRMKNTSF